MDTKYIVNSIVFLLVVVLSFQVSIATVNPEEIGGNFEGDMILNDRQMRRLHFSPRNGRVDTRYRWPMKNGVVTVLYQFDSDADYSKICCSIQLSKVLGSFELLGQKEKDVILDAIKYLEDVSCIKFKEVGNEDKEVYIKILKGSGCSANVGRQFLDDYQKVTLNANCLRIGTIIHEFLHALGFYHMQSSYNRDKHIRINFDNMSPDRRHNFDKYSTKDVSLFDTPYDIDSVMHYGRKFFSTNGLNTIETVDPADIYRIGQRLRMSYGDIQRLNNMYQCRKENI